MVPYFGPIAIAKISKDLLQIIMIAVPKIWAPKSHCDFCRKKLIGILNLFEFSCSAIGLFPFETSDPDFGIWLVTWTASL